MAKRLTAFSSGVQILSSFMNDLQDYLLSLRAGNQNNNLSASYAKGADAVLWHTASNLATDTLRLIDDSIDWRDRMVWGLVFFLGDGSGDATVLPGGALDYTCASGAVTSAAFEWYSGSGAYSNVVFGSAVANGSPPVNGAGVFRSYAAVPATSSGSAQLLYIYADPTTGALYAYNKNVAGAPTAMNVALRLHASGDLNKR